MLTALRLHLDRWLAIAAGTLAAVLTAVVMLGVVSRAFNEPFIWTDEVSRFLMVWLAAAGWMLAGRKRAHIRIRFFHDMLPPKLWAAAELVMQLALVLCGVLLATFAMELVRRNWTIEATTVPVAMSWMYLPVVIAGAATAVQGLVESRDAWRKLCAGTTSGGENGT